MSILSNAPPAEPSRAEVRKNQVLEAATECFRQQGFHGTSMAQISKTAGMSVGHIYHYFENKEAIIAAIVERDLLNLITITDRIRGMEGDVFSAMVADVDACITDTVDDANAPLMLEVVAEAARNPAVANIVRKADREAMAHMRAFIREGLKQYGLSKTDEELDGPLSMMAAMFEGLTVRMIRNPDLTAERYAPVIRSLMQHIIQQHLIK